MENLQSYFFKLNETYEGYLKFLLQEYNEELIHDLRVSIKKIKASFLFFQFAIPGFRIKQNYQNYKEVFQRLGVIRDLQIQQHKFNDWSVAYNIDFTNYLTYLKNEENSNIHKFDLFFKKIKWNNDRKISHRLATELTELEIKNRTISYIEQLIGNIRTFDIKKVHTYEEIHDLRKHLKELQYNLHFFETCLFSRKLFKTHTRKLKALTEELGNWHDNYNLLSYLFAYKLNFFRTKTSQLRKINAFEKDLLRRNKAQMEVIQKRFQEFCNFSPRLEKHWTNHSKC